jgi:predicted O-methyltransferase YrrM
MIIDINKKQYNVEANEFTTVTHSEYNNLIIRNDLARFERIVSLLSELSKTLGIKEAIFYNQTHGGFIPIQCAGQFESIYVVNSTDPNIAANIALHNVGNVFFDIIPTFSADVGACRTAVIYSEKVEHIDMELVNILTPVILTSLNMKLCKNPNYNILELTGTNLYLYIPHNFYDLFFKDFYYFIKDDKLDYDNLINLCIMVKNGGQQFADMLLNNMNFIDRWTILDTGSTDDTIKNIKSLLVGKRKGTLYEEPFINFRESRNRLLDLAGTSCKFIIMLDDTYVITGNLRSFLNEVRGDQISTSFTLYIKSDDTIYGSNRIIKSNSGLRYIHKIHEVITDKNNINIVIPKEVAFIDDRRFDYMEKRTHERKQLDLKLLFEEVEENPHDPRAYYYLAQTYNLLEDYEKAFYYFTKRVEFTNSGFVQERVDALFESARIANFKLNKPWSECEELYIKCYKADETRPEALYFIGIHYYLENNYNKAFGYFKKAFEIGFPIHCQYSLKPTLSYHFLPKFLCKICYDLIEYDVGLKASELFLKNNKPDADSYEEIVSWYKIYQKLCIPLENCSPKLPIKPIFVFHADGGFNNWSGSSILTIGVGGSETYIIEHARYIQKSGKFDVYVFCNCLEEENFEGVIYKPLADYYLFIKQNYIHTCIVSRYSEYLPVTFNGYVENVYLVVHDLTPSGVIIHLNKKLKKIFCLTEWHVEYLTNIFPSLKNMTVPFYYGVDFDKFSINNKNKNELQLGIKEKYKFIYSSFPNRGLLQLLQMWPKIHEFQQKASLHIYSDINGKWVNQVEGEIMKQIQQLLVDYKAYEHNMNIYYYGWVNKQTLAEAWITSDIWFYPCTFMETFCLTALEAALTRTLVVTNDLAALQNTVGDRGVIIKGDPKENLWQETALDKIKKYMDPQNESLKNELIKRNYEWASTLSWESQANKLLQEYILADELEYKGMYNWTNNLPYGHKQYFLEAIEYFNTNYQKVKNGEQVKVLEIGTYAGISLINIVKLIPKSIGFGLDRWSNYIENIEGNVNKKVDILNNMDELGIEASFYKNIETSGLKDRIQGIKGDSYEMLLEMIKESKQFDFIYVDGSHKAFDCYSDLILSWKLLAEGGVIAIDDYLYNTDGQVIESPFEGVNHFLNKFQKEFKILHKGYRVFLQKSAFLQ